MAERTPTKKLSAKKLFGLRKEMPITGFAKPNEYVPEIDKEYIFDEPTTKAVLTGFHHNRHTLLQGMHGSGKSTHIEQIAARLNWGCIRINLDSYISRMELMGRDVITLQDGKQITRFERGLLAWSVEQPIALVLDEYDAARPELLFILQRLLESNGRLTLLEEGKILRPHKAFRIFATANTIGAGENVMLYHGTQPINQGQMDRWHIVAKLNYLPTAHEVKLITNKAKSIKDKKSIKNMVKLAQLTRAAFANHEISALMSPRAVLTWAENITLFGDTQTAFRLSWLNKCEEADYEKIAELYQRAMGEELTCTKP